MACVQEYKQFNSAMMDSITLQLKNEQQLFALLQHRLERVSRPSACFQAPWKWIDLLPYLLPFLASVAMFRISKHISCQHEG